MAAREDFISLFQGYEKELEDLHETHFHLKDFSYMITSQRTTEQIFTKLGIAINADTENVHQNFWPDLARLGLASSTERKLTLFGNAVYEYFQSENNDFKREHFIFNGIRHRAYDIAEPVSSEYDRLVENFYDCLAIIPNVNEAGSELLRNPEKLLITAFLNRFPEALRRYYELSAGRQRRIDSLGESGLKELFESYANEEEGYFKIARRLWNMWRALDRRVNFVWSVVLSSYEEKCIQSRLRLSLDIDEAFRKILNMNLLEQIISRSEKIDVFEDTHNNSKYIGLVGEYSSKEFSKRTLQVRESISRRKAVSKKPIRDPNSLIPKDAPDFQADLQEIDSLKTAQQVEIRRERTKQHQEIVKKLCEFYIKHDIIPNENNFDLLVEKDDLVLLHEVKTIENYNERNQIIKAVGQLLYYEFYELPQVVSTKNKNVIKIVVLQHEPSDLSHIEYLKSLGIYTIWVGEDGEIQGESDSYSFLRSIVS